MSDTYIDLDDVQGNIVKGYGRYGYPKARYVFFRFINPADGRAFLESLLPLITNGRPWEKSSRDELPTATTNVAFSYQGLKHLGLPNESLHSFPDEFTMGMKARADILGDDGPSAYHNWDPVWEQDKNVHMFLSINARDMDAIEERYQQILQRLEACQGVEQLLGHRAKGSDNLGYQDASAIYIDGIPSSKEHFGFTDGISDPYFKGSGSNPANVIGGGKRTRQDPATMQGWEPLETGEFLLGYRDEAKELPEAPLPRLLSMNGTFMVYRKLHQNVGSFNRYIENLAKDFPGGAEYLKAKMVGRWSNGAPLSLFPKKEDADAFMVEYSVARAKLYDDSLTAQQRETAKAHFGTLRKKLTGFDFNQDLEGGVCPMGSHIRRANPRGCLEYGVKDAFDTPGALVDRRRLVRRGLPYGSCDDPSSDNGDHGIIFMALNASIFRQFEFVQQQWMNYGNDFKLSNEKDPIIGNQNGKEHMIIQGQGPENPPFFCPNVPRFVTTRGGEYFFIPSITALRMIALGSIDPT